MLTKSQIITLKFLEKLGFIVTKKVHHSDYATIELNNKLLECDIVLDEEYYIINGTLIRYISTSDDVFIRINKKIESLKLEIEVVCESKNIIDAISHENKDGKRVKN